MALKNKIPAILEHIEDSKKLLAHNKVLFDISEGDLLTYVKIALNDQLGPNSYEQVLGRIPPINIFKKVVAKLSKLYSEGISRTPENENDAELLGEYISALSADDLWTENNENFNSYKALVTELYEDDGEVKSRPIPGHQFLAYGDDPKNPLRMTVGIKFMGKYGDEERFWLYSDEEFLSITNEGQIVVDDMADNEGINDFGVIPFGYKARSKYLLTPLTDTDMLTMVILIVILMADLNLAMKFLAHPQFYGIDIDYEQLKREPSSFWNFKSDPASDKTPQVGVIAPNLDLDSQARWIAQQLAMWLDSRNIRPGAIQADASADAVASGIALMIREMDTTEDRKAQIPFFVSAERDYWNILSTMHNKLVGAGRLKEKKKFSSDQINVLTEFPPMSIIEDRDAKVNRLKIEIDAKLKSQRTAIEELNPRWTEERIEIELEKIDGEKPKIVAPIMPMQDEEDDE